MIYMGDRKTRSLCCRNDTYFLTVSSPLFSFFFLGCLGGLEGPSSVFGAEPSSVFGASSEGASGFSEVPSGFFVGVTEFFLGLITFFFRPSLGGFGGRTSPFLGLPLFLGAGGSGCNIDQK